MDRIVKYKYGSLKNKSKNSKVIFVDYFDTLVFRKVHSFQMIDIWKNKINEIYDFDEDISLLRQECIKNSGKNEFTINYFDLMGRIYDKINFKKTVNRNDFISTCYNIELYADLITQYPNKKMVKWLRKQKNKGKKIYLVSDFYLPKKAYIVFLEHFELIDIFDDIFCSVDMETTKLNGNIYEKIINRLGIDPSSILMIGDSKISDYVNARKYNLNSYRYFPLIHKINTNYKRLTNYNFKSKVSSFVFNKNYKSDYFGEYCLNFWYFIENLVLELKKNNIKKVFFLSRGGYLLKILFDEYCKFFPNLNEFETIYLKNSRKVNKLALTNKEDKELLIDFFNQNGYEQKCAFVDEGWNASSQIDFGNIFKQNTIGYYLGMLSKKNTNYKCLRKGILFDIDSNNNKSFLYGIFRTNCTFYEQICTEPKGSVIKYVRDKNLVTYIEKENELEMNIYNKYTKKIQQKIIENFKGICCFNIKLSKFQLAKYVLKDQIISSKERIKILKDYDGSYYDNLESTSNKFFADVKHIKINLFKLLFFPEEYMRYICKLKILFLKNRITLVIYKCISYLLYFYCLINIYIKKMIYKEKMI